MFRPTRPRMINNNFHNQMPFNNQWRPNHRPHAQNNWRPRPPRHHGPPVNFSKEEHWCETCDRGFPNSDLLEQHKQQHQKCNIDGCQFVAHPKVITKHIQMQHSSGLYKKISKLNNPEEIQKWREERKKKYPTKANIEKKAAQNKEKIERGEKMALKTHNYNTREGNVPGPKQKHNFNNKAEKRKAPRQSEFTKKPDTPHKEHKTHPPPRKVAKTVPETIEKNKLKPFAGIMNLCFDDIDHEDNQINTNDDILIEDDNYEANENKVKETPVQEPVICGALTSLMCDYGSSDEDTGNMNPAKILENNKQASFPVQNSEKLIKKMPQNTDNIRDKLLKQNTNEQIEANQSDDEAPEEAQVIRKLDDSEIPNLPQTTIKEHKPQIRKNIPNRRDNKHYFKFKPKVPSTLLQKLLFKEIRQERNVVLQCIRYIRKNNYFDKSPTPPITD